MATDDVREIRARLVDPVALASALDLSDGAKRQARGLMVRCPVHNERTPSCSIRVAADGTIAVRCHGCNWSGDALSLVAAVRGLDVRRDFRCVLEEAAAIAGYDLPAQGMPRPPPAPPRPPPPPPPKEPRRIPAAELAAFWAATLPVDRTNADPDVLDIAAIFFVARRGWYAPALAELDLVRRTPLRPAYPWPSWWPAPWAETHRLVVRAYDAAGNFVSVHGRSIVPGAAPKTRWPFGYPAGHLFADRRGVALLRGDFADVDRVVIVEGLSDLVAMTMAIADGGRMHAVIGITNGATRPLGLVKWPAVPVVIATDHDDAGQRYAREIRQVLPRRLDVRRTTGTAAQKATTP